MVVLTVELLEERMRRAYMCDESTRTGRRHPPLGPRLVRVLGRGKEIYLIFRVLFFLRIARVFSALRSGINAGKDRERNNVTDERLFIREQEI